MRSRPSATVRAGFGRAVLAGFMAWFIFIGPGLAELTHFVFPVLSPALSAHVREPISQVVSNGKFVANMKNYWLGATGVITFQACTRQCCR